MSTLYAGITLVGTALSTALAVIAWRSRSKPGAVPLVVLTLAIATWNGTVFMATITESFVWSRAWSRLHFLGVSVTGPAVLVLVIEYVGREDLLTRPRVALLAAEPVAVQALLWTNDIHGLFVGYVPAEPGVNPETIATLGFTGTLTADPGIAFWLHAGFVWGTALVALAIVVWWALRWDSLYRRQLGLLAVAIVLPLAASFVDNLLTVPVRLSEGAFMVTAVSLTIAVVRYDLVDVTPIAHSTVLDEMGRSVLVLDANDVVVDLNRAARALLDVDRSVIGTHAAVLFSDYPDVYERFADVRSGSDRIALEVGGEVRHFQVEASPLDDTRDVPLGRVFLINDVTEEIQRRQELERKNEHLETFASVLSHDLRNPLEVASGNVQLAFEADDDEEHLETIQTSHERMEQIIDDVLTMAREGQQLAEVAAVDLAAVADDAWASVATRSSTLENEAHAVVEADRGRLRRALENLFRNAVEHGNEDDVIVRVGILGTSHGRVVDLDQQGFFVEDDGPGIDPEDRADVFDAGVTDSQDGTGLGLAIVQSIVQAHGWQIAVTDASRASSGARFEVTGVGSLRDD